MWLPEIKKQHFIYLFSKRGDGRERNTDAGEVASCLRPDWGWNPPPRCVPWLGMELEAFCFVVRVLPEILKLDIMLLTLYFYWIVLLYNLKNVKKIYKITAQAILLQTNLTLRSRKYKNIRCLFLEWLYPPHGHTRVYVRFDLVAPFFPSKCIGVEGYWLWAPDGSWV